MIASLTRKETDKICSEHHEKIIGYLTEKKTGCETWVCSECLKMPSLRVKKFKRAKNKENSHITSQQNQNLEGISA